MALTSQPTSREAYAATRRWLLAEHGSVCAYCDARVPVAAITLDHVSPRRGCSAFDRRDNLVLACQRCNGTKAAQNIVVWLLHVRSRAVNLVRYGRHLSPGLVEMTRSLAGADAVARADRLADPTYPYAD